MTTTTWDEAFAHRYKEWSAHMVADIAFYVGLAREADGPVVELAVGNGRVAIPIAKATGRRVIGIDASPTMLEQARTRAAEEGIELDLRETDIRDLTLEESAALIYCPFRSLQHLPTWADRRRTFEHVAASLRPGGRFAWNAIAFDHHIAARLDGERKLAPVPNTTFTRSKQKGQPRITSPSPSLLLQSTQSRSCPGARIRSANSAVPTLPSSSTLMGVAPPSVWINQASTASVTGVPSYPSFQ
ncbi:class I SAM-dependent methyltransferase [Nonomuraea purpurea]|uniref:Class I SAM-dependent methyltransferase n=1 Tax=Nonomuraea purpurea TaxID=1849276 RepID=A0ABV8GFJ5_9ACTN